VLPSKIEPNQADPKEGGYVISSYVPFWRTIKMPLPEPNKETSPLLAFPWIPVV